MGNIVAQMFPPKFQPERDMPDLSGKITLVTGGNTGIGYQTVKQLLLKNAKVYLAARSEEKAAAAIQKLEEETKKTALFIQLDLADLPSVRKAAETFLAQEQKLDILFNNGGVMVSPPEMLTAQNFDLQFGTNVIGHYFLTDLLLPALKASYEESKIPARVINTSSMGHQFAPSTGIEFVSLKGGPERDAWVKKAGSFMGPCMGAHTQLWAGTVATPAQITGQYVVPWGQVGKPDKRALNTKLEEEVVAYIKEQVKDF
ncbi:hypothetical protein B0H10DRAFT_2175766 [Mycena sp. CBHHK59/15]|nr:hypothetical protein B0H10DRAFT_2175766 [Mycena sp. CBHHK59/15]